MFRYGIEFECALMRGDTYLDWTNSTFEEIQHFIDQLPSFSGDEDHFSVDEGDVKTKRWYQEVFERYSEDLVVTDRFSKGVEIRTTVHTSLDELLDELRASHRTLRDVLARGEVTLVETAYNPFSAAFYPNPPLKSWEVNYYFKNLGVEHSHVHMMTQGPDVSISNAKWTDDKAIEAVERLTYYSPYLCAMSVNSPFSKGHLSGSKSNRIVYRNGLKAAAMCFVSDESSLDLDTRPLITEKARFPSEVGRIEYKGLDAVPSFEFYIAMLILVREILLSSSLNDSRRKPNSEMLINAGRHGLDDDDIHYGAKKLVETALAGDLTQSERAYLGVLYDIVESRKTFADKLISRYNDLKSIDKALLSTRIE